MIRRFQRRDNGFNGWRRGCLPLILLAAAGCRPPAPAAVPRLAAVPPEASGLRYRFTLPPPRPCNILGTIGNGCAFLDYNRDGSLDVLLVGRNPGLFRGDGRGRFTDVTAGTLGRLSGHFLGCAVGDYDDDGYPDLYLSGYREGRLLRNEAGRRFADVSRAAGIGPQEWGSSASFVDLDGDGRLDLVVGNYIEFSPRHRQYCEQGGVRLACSPGDYFQAKPVVYRNRGGRAFASMEADWGVSDQTAGKALGVAAADWDRSGTRSAYVANDQMPGDLLRLSGGRLKNDATPAGVAYAATGARQAGMGADWGDYDGDGWLDLAVATYENEAKPVYQNLGNGTFAERSAGLGVAGPLTPFISFGVKWLDADNDGWLDLIYTNGHVADNIREHLPNARFRQPTLLLQNRGGRRFQTVNLPDLARPLVGRGVATGDYDNDGRVDVLIADSDGGPVLLHNETPGAGRFLSVRLVGGPKSGRDAYGAEVVIKAGGRRLTRHCHADGSYLSSSDARVHFGLGAAERVDRLTVRWPSGAVSVKERLPAGGAVTVREGE